MAQISKGDTFTNGEQVTGSRLNQLVDSSYLLNGAISEQTALTAGTLDVADLLLISDVSATALRKITINDLLGANFPITSSLVTTPSISSPALNNISITAQNATTVTGKSFSSIDSIITTVSSVNHGLATNDILSFTASDTNYSGTYQITVTSADTFRYSVPASPYVYGKTFTSSNGITAVVTSVAHGLSVGNSITITCNNSAYSGTYAITAVTTDTFSYTISPTSTAASGTCYYVFNRSGNSGTLSYTRNATINLDGNSYITSRLYVGGNTKILGNAEISGNTTIGGSLSVAGGSINGNIAINGNLLIGTNNTLTLDKDPVLDKEAVTKQYVDAKQYPRAWVRFGAGSGGTISDSHNIASATRTSAGQYTITFTTAMPNANYVVLASFTTTSAGQPVGGPSAIQSASYNLTTTGFTFLTSNTTVFVDYNTGNGSINLVVFGD